MIIAICDDEYREYEHINECVENISRIKELNSQIYNFIPEELEGFISKMEDSEQDTPVQENNSSVQEKYDKAPDIVIMDIEFNGVEYDGISLAKRLNVASPNTQIIYLTHILEFAPEVYETDHCYFVMKNNMEVMLPKAFDKALAIYNEQKHKKPLEIINEGHKILIAQDNICYIEKRQRQTIIHTQTDSFSCYDSITSIGKKLSDTIVRCHGGYLVNLSHITYLGGEKIVLGVSDTEIPIGKTYKEHIKHAYLKYWMRRM